MVQVDLLMYCFQASEPDSLPPPVDFSPPKAPPISAPGLNHEAPRTITCSGGRDVHVHDSTVGALGPEPLDRMVVGGWPCDPTWKTLPRSLVKMEEDRPCSTWAQGHPSGRPLTSLFQLIPSSKLEHLSRYTMGAKVSLAGKVRVGG